MNNSILDAIDCTVIQVIETWSGMKVERATLSDTLFVPGKPWILSELSFSGIFNGRYAVICQEALASAFVDKMIGPETERNDQLLNDMLRELVNVLSGNLLPACFGEAVFDLVLPEATRVKPMPLSLIKDKVFYYRVDGHPFAVTFFEQTLTF